MNWKLWGSIGTAAALFIALFAFSALTGNSPADHYINLALLVFGSCSGWLIGSFISPYNEQKKGHLSAYAKAFSAFYRAMQWQKSTKPLIPFFRRISFFSRFLAFGLYVSYRH